MLELVRVSKAAGVSLTAGDCLDFDACLDVDWMSGIVVELGILLSLI